MNVAAAAVLAGWIGFLSMSQELLWVRLLSYVTGADPASFAYVIGSFLLGIGVGARLAQMLSDQFANRRFTDEKVIAGALLLAGVVGLLALPLTGWACVAWGDAGISVGYAGVAATGLLLGGLFPLVCGLLPGNLRGAGAGQGVALLYAANILGSTAGPLLTGFYLVDHFSSAQLWLASAVGCAGAGAVMAARAASRVSAVAAGAVVVAVLAAFAFVIGPGRMEDSFARLHFKEEFGERGAYTALVENSSGVIAVDAQTPPAVYGGGMYDGRFNVDPRVRLNGIERAYVIPLLHPNPERVLVIGLGSGSWSQVLAMHETVLSIDAIEINPGYIQLIEDHPAVSGLLDNPKVRIHIDDGRRWLTRHPDERFDLIVMNTTHHWRNHATNLLSVEFLELCRSHLREGGVIYYNSTGSPEVFYTTAHVFEHVARFINIVAASDRPFGRSPETRAQRIAGFPVLRDPALGRFVKAILRTEFTNEAAALRADQDRILITDDNMATEFKRASVLPPAPRSWSKVLAELNLFP